MSANTAPETKLNDLWRPYREALDRFEAVPTPANWNAVRSAAADFRRKVKRLERETVG